MARIFTVLLELQQQSYMAVITAIPHQPGTFSFSLQKGDALNPVRTGILELDESCLANSNNDSDYALKQELKKMIIETMNT